MEGFIIFGIVIAVPLMSIQYFLSSKLRSPIWGGIIPVFLLLANIFVFAKGIVPLEKEYIFDFAIVTITFFGDWAIGRNKYKKNKQSEIEKMKAKDL